MRGYLQEKARRVRATDPVEGAALDRLREAAADAPPAPALESALLTGEHIAVIAEFKRRSPSAGPLANAGAPGPAARHYAANGAGAVSVLTDAEDFDGSLDDLREATAAGLPVLRKDFLVTDAELYRSRIAGASAALLIVALLKKRELRTLLEAAAAVGLETLVEVHDERELDTALKAGATLIGINNRDLRTLTTDLVVSERIAPRVPDGITLVAESGIRTPGDVRRVRDVGCHAVLVGESLMRLPATQRAPVLRGLARVPRRAK